MIVTVLEVTSVDSPTPACVGNENGSGVVSASWAEQVAFDPPLLPGHTQFHGPLPETGTETLPTHRLVVGAAIKMPPFALPQTPFTGPIVGVNDAYTLQLATTAAVVYTLPASVPPQPVTDAMPYPESGVTVIVPLALELTVWDVGEIAPPAPAPAVMIHV